MRWLANLYGAEGVACDGRIQGQLNYGAIAVSHRQNVEPKLVTLDRGGHAGLLTRRPRDAVKSDGG